jgi:Tol biopolymer transport system component
MHSATARTRISLALLTAAALAAVGLTSTASGAVAVAKHGTELVVFVVPRTGTVGARLEVIDRSGHVLRVLSKAHYGTWAHWSPDDASIAWEDPTGISVESADGTNPRLLVPTNTTCQNCQLSFVWSPDSRALAVGSAGAKGNQLQLVPIDGSAPTVLVGSTDAKHVFTPAWWTPDGKSLVYGESRRTGIATSFLRTLTPATGKTVTLWSTPSAHGFNAPLISPDLRYWAYVKELDQYHQQIRIIDKQTRRTRVVAGVNPTNLNGWSPDSKALGITTSGGHILTVSPTGAISHRFGPGEQFAWGRDSSELFIYRGNFTQIYASENGRPPHKFFQAPKHDWIVSLDAN